MTKKTWLIIIISTITYLLLQLVSLLTGALTGLFSSLPLWILLVNIVIIAVLATTFGLWGEHLKSSPTMPLTEALSREHQKRLLKGVEDKWINHFLNNDRYYDKDLLPLSLKRRIGDPYDQVLEYPLEPAELLPLGTKISYVFDDADGRLLILGEPGAGKTTLLLELTRDLLNRAQKNEERPIPVVLKLSSWATQESPQESPLDHFEQWVVKELRTQYAEYIIQIPTQALRDWVKTSRLCLLLEGLDEVAPDVRPACIKAVNHYVDQANRSIVICSRTQNYIKEQPDRLSLHTAVTIQPLSCEQVKEYLSTRGEHLAGLKNAYEQSETLRELATTPLFLTMLIWTYHGKSAQEVLALVNAVPANQLQRALFQAYVERMLRGKAPNLHTTAQQTRKWLTWLAGRLIEHKQSEMYLEDLQPDWLNPHWGYRMLYRIAVGFLIGFVAPWPTLLMTFLLLAVSKGISSLGISSLFSFVLFLVGLVVFCLWTGLLGGVFTGLLVWWKKPRIKFVGLEGKTQWSWEQVKRSWKEVIEELRQSQRYRLRIGVLLAIVFILVFGNSFVPPRNVFSLINGITMLVWFVLIAVYVLGRTPSIPKDNKPAKQYQYLKGSAMTGAFIWLFATAEFGLLFWLIPLLQQHLPLLSHLQIFSTFTSSRPQDIPGILTAATMIGTFVALAAPSGWRACILYVTLRIFLWRTKAAPLQYARFLDDAEHQRLLRKIGSGYAFVHLMLRDYFGQPETKPPN
jgi:DNA polymerase III delta prime subunit